MAVRLAGRRCRARSVMRGGHPQPRSGEGASAAIRPSRTWAGRMAGMSAPLLLLDGASMWFRSYFGVPSSITSPDGRPVNAVRGFLDSVATLITRQRPHRLVVCLDLDWRPQF